MHRVGTDQKPIDIAIVGAGISGLSLAHFLQRYYSKKNGLSHPDYTDNGIHKLSIFLFDAAKQTGGWIRTRRDGPYLYELGPESLQTKHTALLELIEDLNLSKNMIFANKMANKRQIYFDSKLRSFEGLRSLVDRKAINFRDLFRLATEVVSAKRPLNDTSLYNFGTQHFGKRNTLTLLDAMQSGIYAGNIHTLSAESAFPSMFRRARKDRSILKSLIFEKKRAKTHLFSFHDGLAKIIDTLSDRFSPITQRRVVAVRQDSDYAELIFQDHFVQAKHVILTTPATVSAKLLESAVPNGSPILRTLPYSSLVVATLAFKKEHFSHATLNQIKGFGFLTPRNAGLRILGALYSSNSFGDRCPSDEILIRVFLGGQCDPDILDLDDARIRDICRLELGTVLGDEMQPVYCRIDRHANAIPHFEVGHAARMRDIKHKLKQRCPRIHLTGSSYCNGVGVLVERAKDLAKDLLRKVD